MVAGSAAAKKSVAKTTTTGDAVISKKSGTHKNSNCRLYVKGHFQNHRRGKNNVYPNESILKIDGVHNKKDCHFYIGKTVIYALGKKNGKKSLVKGKIMAPHGNSGAFRARFERNLQSAAHSVRVMLYPSNI